MKRFEKDQVNECYEMLTHLYFKTNNVSGCVMGIGRFLEQYTIPYNMYTIVGLKELKIVKSLGANNSGRYVWTGAKPSKFLARQVLEKSYEKYNNYMEGRKTSDKKIEQKKVTNQDPKLIKEKIIKEEKESFTLSILWGMFIYTKNK